MPRVILFTALLFVTGGFSSAMAVTSESELGKSIFEYGIGRDGREIGGRIHGHLVLRGQAVACGSCHGGDARGGGEAFVRAPDIRWHTLSKSFAPRRIGEPRPAYDQSTFARALHQGIGSNNGALDPAMPRFDLSQDETEALRQYLSIDVERRLDGEAPTKVVLGLVPATQSQRFPQELGNRLKTCASTRPGERFPPLEVLQYENPVDALSKVEAKIAEERVSYIVAPYIAGWETQYVTRARTWPIPTLLPVSPLDLPAHPNIGFALPGLASQVGALLDRGLARRPEALTVVMSQRTLQLQDVVQLVRKELRSRQIRVDEVLLESAAAISQNQVWLVLVPLEKLATKLQDARPRNKVTTLVPAMFFDPEAAQRITQRSAGMTWLIAYPYQPKAAQSGRWWTPTEAWSEAGCALMAMIAENTGQDWVSHHPSITLRSGMTLLSVSDALHRRGQVIVEKWEPDNVLGQRIPQGSDGR
jgi:mono/diheme cytochrome c family protein